jgi:hypothetical protein
MDTFIESMRADGPVQRDDHGQPLTARPRHRPWNPYELDEEGVEQQHDAADEWEANGSEARKPVCPRCGNRVTRVNGVGGRLVFTCGEHISETPEWVPDPSARTSRGVASFALTPEPSSRRPRGLTQGDVASAVRSPRTSQPRAAASYLDPAPRSARPLT